MPHHAAVLAVCRSPPHSRPSVHSVAFGSLRTPLNREGNWGWARQTCSQASCWLAVGSGLKPDLSAAHTCAVSLTVPPLPKLKMSSLLAFLLRQQILRVRQLNGERWTEILAMVATVSLTVPRTKLRLPHCQVPWELLPWRLFCPESCSSLGAGMGWGGWGVWTEAGALPSEGLESSRHQIWVPRKLRDLLL